MATNFKMFVAISAFFSVVIKFQILDHAEEGFCRAVIVITWDGGGILGSLSYLGSTY